jgi:hypothetical protein
MPTDEELDDLIMNLNSEAMRVDPYEFGLPTAPADLEILRAVIVHWMNENHFLN